MFRNWTFLIFFFFFFLEIKMEGGIIMFHWGVTFSNAPLDYNSTTIALILCRILFCVIRAIIFCYVRCARSITIVRRPADHFIVLQRVEWIGLSYYYYFFVFPFRVLLLLLLYVPQFRNNRIDDKKNSKFKYPKRFTHCIRIRRIVPIYYI